MAFLAHPSKLHMADGESLSMGRKPGYPTRVDVETPVVDAPRDCSNR
jgi:hypothetical protein